MQSKRSSVSYDRGFTLVELLAASSLSMIVLALGLGSLLAQRNTYKYDITRTLVNQNLRSALDIATLNVRQAGEALPDFFPSILIKNGATDELIVRRNLYENEILNVCQALTAGTSNTTVQFAYNTTTAACAYNTALVPYLTTWNAYRVSEGGTAKAYVYNRVSRLGEFFTYNGGTNTGSILRINKAASNWRYAYPGDGNSAAMYLLEEFRFKVSGGIFQIVKNENETETLNVADNITNFQVSAKMRDGTTNLSFTAAERWPDIDYLELSLTGHETFGKRVVDNTVTTRLFPRNILSK